MCARTGHSARCIAVADAIAAAKEEWMEIDVSKFQGRRLKQWELEIERDAHDRRALRAVKRSMARDRANRRKEIKAKERAIRAANVREPTPYVSRLCQLGGCVWLTLAMRRATLSLHISHRFSMDVTLFLTASGLVADGIHRVVVKEHCSVGFRRLAALLHAPS